MLGFGYEKITFPEVVEIKRGDSLMAGPIDWYESIILTVIADGSMICEQFNEKSTLLRSCQGNYTIGITWPGLDQIITRSREHTVKICLQLEKGNVQVYYHP